MVNLCVFSTAPVLSFGDFVCYLRRFYGLTQHQFARKIRVDPATVRRWEIAFAQYQYPIKPSKRNLQKMALAYPIWRDIIGYYEQSLYTEEKTWPTQKRRNF